MRFKKYLLYLLILIVAGAIAVSIFFAVKDRDQDKAAEEAQSVDAEGETAAAPSEDAVDADPEPEEEIEPEPEIFEDHYTSSSGDFTGYTIKCPEGWVIKEEESGKTLMLSNAGMLLGSSSPASEYIMIKVEGSSSLEDGPQGLIDAYEEKAAAGSYEMIEGFEADTGDGEVDITGYSYSSGFAGSTGDGDDTEIPGEIDLMTYAAEDDHIYIIKYMASGIEKDAAIKAFKGFLKDFEIGGEISGDMTAGEYGSMNILILGVDSGLGREWGRKSARSDINMILHINLQTYGATIVTIPRDLWVPIPGHNDGKINGAYTIGGPELAIETFESFSGLDIDNYIITDFDGFIPLIDYLGGVTIEVGEDMADGFSGCYLSRGVHHLNGEQALALCRNRYRKGDGSTQGGAWAREREAAKVIKALYEQKTTLDKILALPAFADFLLRYTWTDMNFIDLMRILPVLGNIGTPEIELRGVPSYSKMIGKASAVVHYEEETAQMFEEIKNQ
jgi:LCP family protein required for cell wall assembly